MKILSAIKTVLITIVLLTSSLNVGAETFNYRADVRGMTCAFCAYSVSKNISALPGVNAESVDVSLVDERVIFSSDKKVSAEKVSSIFSESGFTISNLTFSKDKTKPRKPSNEIVLDMTLDLFKATELVSIIEAVGQYATNSSSQVILEAPQSEEKTILGPLLMGRQEVIKIRFIPTESDKIHLQLLSKAD